MYLMHIIQYYKLIKEIFRTTNNPVNVLLYRARIINETKISTKNYGLFKITSDWENTFIFNLIYSYLVNIPPEIKPSKRDITVFRNFINDILIKKDTITVDNLTFINNNTICTVSERLTDKYNVKLNVKDKVVLDLGANICDTALYYAKDGAKKVYSYEASPTVYTVALKNLDLNPQYKDIIELYNIAISNKDVLQLPIEEDTFSAVTSEYNDTSNKEIVEVNTITINEIVENLNGNVDVLKLDIEGSEFDLVDNTDFSVFDEMLIEYHSSLTGISRNVITDKLENQGFNVEVLQTAYYDIDDFGLIHATKN